MKKALTIAGIGAGAAVLFFVGVGAGAAGGSDVESAPAVTITAEAEPQPAVTIEAEATEVVPQACLDALDDADEVILISADFAQEFVNLTVVSADAVEAAFYLDVDALDQATADLEVITSNVNTLTARLDGSTYAQNAAACRG